MNKLKLIFLSWYIFTVGALAGCTVKAVGDPNRPITIEAHVTVDIRELKSTANDIEDFVSGKKSKDDLKAK